MIEQLKYLAGYFSYMQAPLDRDSWLDNKEDMDFNEAPPEISDLSMEVPDVDPTQWTVVFRTIAIAILAGLLIYLIVRLISNSRNKSTDKKNNIAEVDSTEEGPTALSPLEELWMAYQNSKKENNFREAVRILYQIVIKHLDSQGKLKAAAEKTNREYTQEMTWSEKAQDFFQLTLLHEFSWYGNKEVSQLDFERAEPRFLEFIESIKNG